MLTHILKSVCRYIHIFINTQRVWIYHCELDREGEGKIYPTLLLQRCHLVAPLHLILCSYKHEQIYSKFCNYKILIITCLL